MYIFNKIVRERERKRKRVRDVHSYHPTREHHRYVDASQ
jgi:hypothetical protein